MVRSIAALTWSVAACASMAIACWADTVEPAQAEAPPAAVSAAESQPAAPPSDESSTTSDDSSATTKSKTASQPADVAEKSAGDQPQDKPADSAGDKADAPAQDQSDAAQETTAAAAPVGELIEERYPNRAVKIERHVVQDAAKNYVNHGKWTMFDEKGRMLGCGDYWQAARHGLWTRWHIDRAPQMFSEAPYDKFEGPFASEAVFDNGKLHGTWAVFDSRDRKCSEFTFEHGDRNGKSVWYYPSGAKMREIDFIDGQIDGRWQEWGTDSPITRDETYQHGRRLGRRVEQYASGQAKSETGFLFAREILKCQYDWWNASITTATAKEGVDVRQGLSTTWYKNGQKEKEGEYAFDLPVGKHTWWYENGQKMIEGDYESGDRTGSWTWWHENGQKQSCGAFAHDSEVGSWTWWNEEGTMVRSVPFPAAQPSTSAAPAAGQQMATAPARSRGQRPAAKQAQAPRKSSSTPTRR